MTDNIVNPKAQPTGPGSSFRLPIEIRFIAYECLFPSAATLRHVVEIEFLNKYSVAATQQANNILDFPRLKAYENSRNHQESTILLFPFINATILRTCRAIYDEATTIFYKTNRFYHSICVLGKHFVQGTRLHFAYPRTLSVDFSDPISRAQYRNTVSNEIQTKKVVNSIRMVNTRCTALENFTFHIIHPAGPFGRFRRDEGTCEALRNLALRLKYLKIITCSHNRSMVKLCEASVPEILWAFERLHQVPRVKRWPELIFPVIDFRFMEAVIDVEIWNCPSNHPGSADTHLLYLQSAQVWPKDIQPT